ncbi:fluoride efflux transporter FluC [Paeniglutamicibacter sp. NPDC091659]|uniref:fluoride efflux transporter FluC n=1 Tax=Paeniglutamicibacter sp. NPDC091659 TaxID=3364389 RepID=UPI0037F80DC1
MGGADRPNHLKWRMWAVVAVGGTFGAVSREAFSLFIPAVGDLPVAIAIVNILGAFLLGFLYEALTRPGISGDRASRLKLLLGTGFCGGFTTYSSLAVDTALLGINGRSGTALFYVLGTVVLGACATWAGLVAGSRSARTVPESSR